MRVSYERQRKGSDLSFDVLFHNGMQVQGGLKRLSGFKVHALSKISYSQVGARRRDSPGIGAFCSGKDAHESGLARPVGTDETDALVVADAERDVLKNRLDAVSLRKMMYCKHMHNLYH